MSGIAAASGLRAVLFATPRPAADLPIPADFPVALLPLGHAPLVYRRLQPLACDVLSGRDAEQCQRERDTTEG